VIVICKCGEDDDELLLLPCSMSTTWKEGQTDKEYPQALSSLNHFLPFLHTPLFLYAEALLAAT
jgi:hypothetical protein